MRIMIICVFFVLFGSAAVATNADWMRDTKKAAAPTRCEYGLSKHCQNPDEIRMLYALNAPMAVRFSKKRGVAEVRRLVLEPSGTGRDAVKMTHRTNKVSVTSTGAMFEVSVDNGKTWQQATCTKQGKKRRVCERTFEVADVNRQQSVLFRFHKKIAAQVLQFMYVNPEK